MGSSLISREETCDCESGPIVSGVSDHVLTPLLSQLMYPDERFDGFENHSTPYGAYAFPP